MVRKLITKKPKAIQTMYVRRISVKHLNALLARGIKVVIV